jgi:hypothetical protein
MLSDERLAEAAAALEQDVLAAVDEVELDEALDECPVDLLWVLPLEAVEGLERAQAGKPCPPGEVDGDAGALLEVGELLEGLGGPRRLLWTWVRNAASASCLTRRPRPRRRSPRSWSLIVPLQVVRNDVLVVEVGG